jgi:hypothetical protein
VTSFYAVATFYLAGGLLAVVVARMPASGAKLEPLGPEQNEAPEILVPQAEAAEL